MKVLITTDWYRPVVNGVVTSVLSLESGLTSLGHEVRILTLSNDRRSRSEGNATYIGSIGAGGIYPNARLRIAPSDRYIRELIDWRPDVVHSQCEFSTFALAKKIAGSCGCPLVHTYHTVYEDFTHYFSPSIRLGKRMAALFSRKILAKTQAVIVPSEKIKALLQGYGVELPIAVRPSGLELAPFERCPGPPRTDSLREDLGIASSDRVLLYLGRLALEKNIGELITLFSQSRERDLKLLLVGDGPYRPQLEAQAQSLGLGKRIIFAGMAPPPEVARYYRLGDIFVSASQSETQGLTYIEAMASGLPLLCRDDPCLYGVIQSGVNGFTFRGAEEFHKTLRALLEDDALRRSVGGAARETAFLRYSSKGFAEGVAEVYREAVKRDGAERAVVASAALCA